MGNINLLACGQGRQIPEEDVLKAENMVRVCRMRKQVLGKQHAQLLLQAKEQKEKNPALSMRPIALQLHQMKQQLKKLEEVEMNFINIASISQTTGTLKSITQSYNTARDETENINIDDVLDLQDAIREQQETFAEIDQALSQSCKSHIFLHRYGLIVHFFFYAGMLPVPPIDQPPFSGGPSSGPDMPQEKLLEQELEAYSEVETNQEPKKQPQTNPISMKDLPSPPSSKEDLPKTIICKPETEYSQQPQPLSA